MSSATYYAGYAHAPMPVQYVGHVQYMGHVPQPLDLEGSASPSDADSSDGADARGARCRTWAGRAGLVAVALACACGFAHLGGLNLASLVPAARGARADDGREAVESQSSFRQKVLLRVPPTAPPAAMLAVGAPTAAATTAGPPTTTVTTTEPLQPQEHLHDGNVCEDNEELYAGLCYKKCSILTGGNDPIRTSPWTCCDSHPCITNQRAAIGEHVACTGFDVSGEDTCPHRPGTCLSDEELLLGVCFKKCTLLTDGQYPHRVAPATCCEESGLGCLDFRKDYTSTEFAVGGGQDGPGACRPDEELLLGSCYKRCSLLTDGRYPHRLAAATCCKAGSRLPHRVGNVWHLGCLDFRLDQTSKAFDVRGDGNNTSLEAYKKAHWPVKSLTEAEVGHVMHA